MLDASGSPWVAVLVAVIASLPPTLVAVGALRHSRTASHHAQSANHAVNNRPPGSPTISEQVSRMADDLDDVRRSQAGLARQLGRHLRWHDQTNAGRFR